LGINNDSLVNLLKVQQGTEKAATLNLLGENVLSDKPEEALGYIMQAYKLSAGKDYKNEIYAISNIVQAYSRTRKYDSSDIFVEKGLKLSRDKQDTVRMMEFLTNIGWTYYYQGKYNKALSSFNEALAFFRIYLKNHPEHTDINILNYAKLLNNKATIYTKQAYYDSAMVYFTESLEFRQKHNAGTEYIAPTLLNIGAVCYKNENYKLAGEYFNNALEKYIELKDSARIASCYSNMGMVNKKTGNYKKAIEYYEKALKINTVIKDKRGRINTLNNLGTIFLQTEQTEKAKDHLLEALKLNSNSRYKSSLSVSYQNLANYYYLTNNFPKAIESGLKSLGIMKEKGQRSNIEDVYLVLSNAYEKQGEFEIALKYFKLHKSIHDSIFNAKSRANYNKLQLQLETSQKERKIESLKREQEKQILQNQILRNEKQNYIILIGLIIFVVIIVGFIVFIKRRKDQQIHRQKEIVHRKEKELALSELEKSKLKEEELRQSILYKSKQLSTHALHMMQKNSMLQEIQSNIKALWKKADMIDKPNFKRINLQINQSLRSHKDWDVFKLYFEDVNKNFYQKLNEINPELTTNDHRLCALIKLNMTSKEMASVLNVAPNSIKSSRYRLKKKLGLDTETDLEDFVRGI
jgi:tetratricopeptide (TPR) repeat protein